MKFSCTGKPHLLALLGAGCFLVAVILNLLIPPALHAEGSSPISLEPLEVRGKAGPWDAEAESAASGAVFGEEISRRPLSRQGEILETVPGLIATQHSGEGKANQYFLRGFNLDHGTDLSVSLDGVPVNMPTHGHGQGYADINFIIPELLDAVHYRKGPYFVEEGDFAAAGSVNLRYKRSLDHKVVTSYTGGEFNYHRSFAAVSLPLAQGNLLTAFEGVGYGGPWELDQNLTRFNGVVSFTRGDEANGFNLTAMMYSSDWTSTDQIPKRSVDNGSLSRFGFVDPTDGGNSYRQSVSGSFNRVWSEKAFKSSFYFIDYRMNLFSNFTFFLDDPVNGDQFEQIDERRVYGSKNAFQWKTNWLGSAHDHKVGLEARHDDIHDVGLFKTRARQRLDTVRRDQVRQTHLAWYYKLDSRWTDYFRTILGFRGNWYHFNVNSDRPANSGHTDDLMINPKVGAVLGPWRKTRLFINYGKGFHSNDGRGTTMTVDPATGTPVGKVNPLVEARGTDVGIQSFLIPRVDAKLALFKLDLDSELIFVGDAGTTEASRSSERLGVELSLVVQLTDWMVMDADFAYTRARFDDVDPAGDRIPGAVEGVASIGVFGHHPTGWFGGGRLRYFGPRPLTEDNRVRSNSTTVINARLGYRYNKNFSFQVDVFNLFDSRDHDIDYFYESQLAGEPGPVEDIHFHPVEPRMVRARLTLAF